MNENDVALSRPPELSQDQPKTALAKNYSESALSLFIYRSYRRRRWTSLLVCAGLGLATLIVLTPLFSVFGYVVLQGFPALNMDFFTQLPAPVGEKGGGLANSLLGTLILIAIASSIGVPWGIITGLYLSEYGHSKRAHLIRFCTDVLSSIPSIIIGLFIYAIIVIPMKRFSALAGGIALGLLMIPTIARSTEELLKMVPNHLREAGLALGIPRWKVTLFIVLRGSASAIATGVILAVARVSGETAPLLFTALNSRLWPGGLDQPISSLPVQIYTYAIAPFDDWHQKAWAGALLLVFLVFAVNLVTRLLLAPVQRRGR